MLVPPVIIAVVVVVVCVQSCTQRKKTPAQKSKAKKEDDHGGGFHLDQGDDEPQREQTIFEKTLPAVLGVLFVLYPMVTKVAFDGFPCYSFEDGAKGWLRQDVSLSCIAPDERPTLFVWLAVFLYPIGIWAFCFLLLAKASTAIIAGKDPNTAAAAGEAAGKATQKALDDTLDPEEALFMGKTGEVEIRLKEAMRAEARRKLAESKQAPAQNRLAMYDINGRPNRKPSKMQRKQNSQTSPSSGRSGQV